MTAVRKFGSFKETFQLYNDSSFMYGYSLNEAATLQIVIPRRIFFGIKISEVDPKKFVIQVWSFVSKKKDLLFWNECTKLCQTFQKSEYGISNIFQVSPTVITYGANFSVKNLLKNYYQFKKDFLKLLRSHKAILSFLLESWNVIYHNHKHYRRLIL